MSTPLGHLRGLPFVDLGDRRSGKTTRLIELAHKDWLYIVCFNAHHRQRVSLLAERLGLDIPFPITFDDLAIGRFHARGIRGFLFDEVGVWLEQMAKGVPVVGMTVSSSNPTPPKENS